MIEVGSGQVFASWLATFLYELATEVEPSEKIKGYESLLILAFNEGMSPHDEELIAMIPYRLTDPELLERDKRARSKIKNPLLLQWLKEHSDG